MTRDFLKGLGIADDIADKIMAENGKNIEAVKAKFGDYDDLKKQLETAKTTMDKFKDYDQVKADVQRWKDDYEKAVAESQKKIMSLERQGKIKDYLGSKKFVNDLTKEALSAKLLGELEKEESKGKSLDDLFKAVTDGMTNIIVDDKQPQPPKVGPMGGGGESLNGVEAAFYAAHPELKP